MANDEKQLGIMLTTLEFWVMSLVGIVIGTVMLPFTLLANLFITDPDYRP
jgi:hypothetical protein